MIRLSKPNISSREVQAVQRALECSYLGMSTEVNLFEQELNQYFGADVKVVCVNTGTAALQLALQAVGVGKGDEVLVPTITYVASFQAIKASGAIPIACDVNLSDVLLNLDDAKKRLTNKTKAIMPVHYAGHVGDLKALYTFAKEHNLRVVEDAAHAFGTQYQQQKIGAIGDVVCFSFDGIKNITSGEGGAVVSSDPAVTEKIADLRLLGVEKDSQNRYKRERAWDFDVKEQGWRYHMSDIMASIGREQLKRFESEFKPKRIRLANYYRKLLSTVPQVQLLDTEPKSVVAHIMPIRVLGGLRNKLREACIKADFQVGIHYKPNHLLSFFTQPAVTLPVSEQLYGELLTLPLHTDLNEQEVEYIVASIRKAFNS